MQNALFEAIAFDENPIYQRIIEDIVAQKYAIIEDFFTLEEVHLFRQYLIDKHKEDVEVI